MSRCFWSGFLALTTIAVKVAFGGNPIDSMQWATVGSAGNAPYTYYDKFEDITYTFGGVAHEFRITRTEVTAAQYLDFVQAYAPYVDPQYRTNSEFMSLQLDYDFENGQVVYSLDPRTAPYPVRVGWRFAARYVNWLHNDRGTSREAFETGVYDTSTFHTNPDGSITDQASHSPDAKFWIPTQDEWIKAAYFDPHRYGPDEPGYWQYPHSSDVPPVPGPPGVGESSAGWDFAMSSTPPAGAYPDTQSPWGLWDMSGGTREWTEAISPAYGARGVQGSWAGQPVEVSWLSERFPGTDEEFIWSLHGFRVAASVPSPASTLILFGAVFIRRASRSNPLPSVG